MAQTQSKITDPLGRLLRSHRSGVAVVAVVGCMALSSLFASTKTTPTRWRDHQRRLHSKSRKAPAPSALVDLGTTAARAPDAGTRSRSVPDAASSWWEDIDYDGEVRCGGSHCYFPSSSDPTHGYLIVPAKVRSGEDISYPEAKKAYDYEKDLESAHNARVFSTSPPFSEKTPEYFLKHLSLKVKYRARKRFRRHASVVVQPSLTAPKGSVDFKCCKSGPTLGSFDHVIEHGNEETLLKELEDTVSLVVSRPELTWDFQLMIDLEGRIYHMDLERVTKKGKRMNRTKRCLKDSINYIRNSKLQME